MFWAIFLGLVALCRGQALTSPRDPTGQDKYEINRFYYCKGPNLAIGSKCEEGIDCRSGFCAGQDISDCRGTCRNKRADGQLAYKVGFMPQYESCVAEHGICATCGEQVALEKPCTKAHQCRSEWCEGIRTDGCKGMCKARRPDGAAAYEVCQHRGKACTPDYHSCVSVMGICGRCGIPNLVGQGCSKDKDCEEGAYCAAQKEDGPEDCSGKCVRMREDEEEAYVPPWQPVKEWGLTDYKSCKNFNPEEEEPGHCGYCAANLLGLGKLCAFDADCEENLWCAGGGSDKLAAISLNRADCSGTCAACPVECGDYGCNIREGDAAILQCGMRTPENTYFLPKVRVGIPILGQVQCFGVRTKKLVRLIEDDLTEDKYPYTMHISWSPKLKVKDPTKGKLPATAKQAAEAEAVDDGVVSSPKFDNCASIRKIRVQTLSTTGTTDQGVQIISHSILTPKTGCVGIKYGLDGKFTVKLSNFHVKVKSAFEFKSPDKEVTDGEYEMDVPNELMKTLYYGAFMHGHLPMFVRIIAKPRLTMTIRGKIKPNRTFRMKWANALVGNAAFAYSPAGSSYTNEMKLGKAGGDMVGARDQNPFEFFDVLDGDEDATLWVRVGYQFSVEVNGLGFQLFPAIGGALRMKKEVAPGCNAAAPKTIFNNIYESKQVAIKTQILGLKGKKPKCGEKVEMPPMFDTTESMIKMCKDIGNFRYSNELVCHDEIINWALSVTTKEKISTHLDKACKAIVERMKVKHKMVTKFPYHAFEDVKFSKAYWTYLVSMGDLGPDAMSLDCDPDATFSSSGSINDVCIDMQDLRAVTPCERDPQSATCHVSKVTGLDGKLTGATASPPKDGAAEGTAEPGASETTGEPGAKEPEEGKEAADDTKPPLEEGEAPEKGAEEDAKTPEAQEKPADAKKQEADDEPKTPEDPKEKPADAKKQEADDEPKTPNEKPADAKKQEAEEDDTVTPAPENVPEKTDESLVSDNFEQLKERADKMFHEQSLKSLVDTPIEAQVKTTNDKGEAEVAAILEINGGYSFPVEAMTMGLGVVIILGALWALSRRSPKGLLSYALLAQEEV